MPEFKKYLGIDWGEKRIGLALADNELSTATPFKIISNLKELLTVIKEEEPDELIIGEPLKMGSTKKSLNPDFVSFLEKIKKSTNLPIHLSDERLSSSLADSLVGDKKTKAGRDAVAAMIILQNYLDSKI